MPITLSTAGRVESQLSGTAGITTWPTATGYANGVSLAEVIAYIQDGTRRGTGTTLPANTSLYDVLKVPAADNVLNVNINEVIGQKTDAAAAGAVTTTDTLVGYIKQLVTMLGTAADTDPVSTALTGTGIATMPAALAPANGVNAFELLRDIWDGVRNGTGGTEPGANKSIVDAIGFDGAASVTSTAGMLRTAAGTYFTVTKALTSSAILTTGVSVTGNAAGGDIYVQQAIFQTDATGLAAGTNFQLQAASNTEGRNVVWSETVANLGASVTEDFTSGSVQSAAGGFVLKSGKSIAAACTAANCTGTGVLNIYLVCMRMADGASLAAA